MKKQLLALGMFAAVTISAQAATITGGISFAGDYRAYTDAAGTIVANDLTQADQIRFGVDAGRGINATYVVGTSGSFNTVGMFSVVSMYTPVDVNPAILPGGAIWSVGGFSLTLTSLNTTKVDNDELTLEGFGTLAGGGFDSTVGTWIATFNTAGSTFSWSSSSAAVPEGGLTAGLLGLGMLAMTGARRFLKR